MKSLKIETTNPLYIWSILLGLFTCVIYTYYCYQIYRNSPENAKKSALLALIGGIIFGFFTVAGYTFGLNKIIPGYLGFCLSIGSLISSIAFTLDSRLVRVLLDTSNNAKVKLRRELEDQLVLSEERFQKLVATMDEIIYEFDLDGKCIYTNQSHHRILGYPLLNFSISKIEELIHDDEKINFSSMVKRVDEGKSIKNMKFRIKSISGKFLTFLLNIAPKFDLSKKKITGFFVLARDIDKMEKYDLRLIRSQKMESIGKLAGGIAHDFNNFLQAILGYTDLLLFDIDKNSENYEYIQEIKDVVKNGANVTRQLLILSRQQEVEYKH